MQTDNYATDLHWVKKTPYTRVDTLRNIIRFSKFFYS